ncbi:MAG: EAL domain-containing protein [Sphingobium sp.]|nr:EAL domain-containing protein [Sphingobium sp.]
MTIGLLRSSNKRNTRKGWISIVWILIITSVLGAIEFGEPLEDLYRGGRNYLRQRPADGTIAVVAMDDRSIETYGNIRFPLAQDAQLVDRIFSLGAKRVYIDRIYADRTDKANDNAFIAALQRHKGRVFLSGMTIATQKGDSNQKSGSKVILSHPDFLAVSETLSLNGYATPFSLSAELVYGTDFPNGFKKSISASLADIHTNKTDYYRPDWAIQASTVPTYSYVDVITGKVTSNAFKGKDVIIGPTSLQYQDEHNIVGQGWISGVYFHAIGAQTLKEGTPTNWGWLPAYGLALIFSIAIVRARSKKGAIIVNSVAIATGFTIPFIGDISFVTADYIPAFLLFGLISYRTNSLREFLSSQRHHEGTNLPNLAVLQEDRRTREMLIIAMRIRNYAAICAGFDDNIGNELVTELSRRMQLTSNASIYYQAEDVLYLLSPVLDGRALEEHLQGMAQILETQLSIRGRMIDIQTSFGVDQDMQAPVESRITKALYAADSAAAANKLWEVYERGSDTAKQMKLSLMSELDIAMDREELWLAYQPQIDIRTNEIVGAEALARWIHPEHGFIPPDEFIQTAERYNRVTRLTLYLLELGTRSCKKIVRDNPDFRLSVNISAGLLEDPSLPAQIRRVLLKTGFPSENLTLEITETTSFAARETANATLQNLQSIGIRISIDDYGTGNATMDYLRSIPWDEVKLDRQFISDIISSAADRHMVETTIDLAHRLNRTVVAEGIEDQATLDLLRTINCDLAQGYHLARPMPINQLVDFIAAQQRHWSPARKYSS